MVDRCLGLVIVGDAADEFEIRPAPDWLPGLLFVPVRAEKAGKNGFHLDFRPVDQTAEVEPDTAGPGAGNLLASSPHRTAGVRFVRQSTELRLGPHAAH
jgi:hypothetical protein